MRARLRPIPENPFAYSRAQLENLDSSWSGPAHYGIAFDRLRLLTMLMTGEHRSPRWLPYNRDNLLTEYRARYQDTTEAELLAGIELHRTGWGQSRSQNEDGFVKEIET